MTEPCICGSNKPFTRCCERFISGSQHAKTPEQLMRSRYTAYALGGYGEYLLATWFPATAGSLTAAALSQRNGDWVRLEVLAKQQRGDKGTVEFKAWHRDHNGEEQVLHEKSVFQRSGGRWLYIGGEVSTGPDQG